MEENNNSQAAFAKILVKEKVQNNKNAQAEVVNGKKTNEETVQENKAKIAAAMPPAGAKRHALRCRCRAPTPTDELLDLVDTNANERAQQQQQGGGGEAWSPLEKQLEMIEMCHLNMQIINAKTRLLEELRVNEEESHALDAKLRVNEEKIHALREERARLNVEGFSRIVDAANVEPSQQQQVDDQPTASSKAPIQEPSTGGTSSSGLDAPMANTNITVKQEVPDEMPSKAPIQEPSTGGASSSGLDAPMPMTNIKQEYPVVIPQEVKQEINDATPSEFDELILKEQQQPTTSATAPPPAKRSRAEELKEKRELKAILKQREERSKGKRFPIDPKTLPIPPGYAIVPETRPKRACKRKKQ